MITFTSIYSSSVFSVVLPGALALQPCVGLGFMVLWRFHNSKFVLGRIVNPMSNPQPEYKDYYTFSGPYQLICLIWVGLPGAQASATVALQVIGACKTLRDKSPKRTRDNLLKKYMGIRRK
jgi:hypothetical protein